MASASSKHLMLELVHGGKDAARTIHDRYVDRLIALARQRISPKLASRIDPEDVVQSAYRSFFMSARGEHFVLERAGDLWRLLAAVTLNKLHAQVERHTAQRRDIRREQAILANENDSQLLLLAPSSEPSPDEVVAIIEQLKIVMQQANLIERRILELRLAGQSIEKIAVDVDRSQRTVRRLLEKLRLDLQQQLAGD